MSVDPVVLQCLSAACGQQDLQLFERAGVTFSSGGDRKTCYVCIGKHCIFFVGKEMQALVDGCGRLPYTRIARAVVDVSAARLLLLELAPAPDGGGASPGSDAASLEYDWEGGERLLIDSAHREALLERVALCWQAEHMFRAFQVKKFPQARATIGALLGSAGGGAVAGGSGGGVGDAGGGAGAAGGRKVGGVLKVLPFRGYKDAFAHRGYSVFLREDFASVTGLKDGLFSNAKGWEVLYNSRKIRVPPGVEVALHVSDPVSLADLDRTTGGDGDLRTVGSSYKEAVLEHLDQFYILANGSYLKKMNRTGDIASWDGWEFLIRARDDVFACILLRREYIPPLCDIAQDIAVLLRCPSQHNMDSDLCEVLLDECRFVADSIAPVAEAKDLYKDIIQARLDTLQCTDDAYRWIEGRLGLSPVHKSPAALKFLKAIIALLERGGQLRDSALLSADVFRDIPVLRDPLVVAKEMLSDAEPLLGIGQQVRAERRSAWFRRISSYLAYCVDGGILGERFTLSTVVQASLRGVENDEEREALRSVIEFLLHVTPRSSDGSSWLTSRVSLVQLLGDPDGLGRYTFNSGVLRILLCERYLSNEWSRLHRSGGAMYESLLAALLRSPDICLPMKTLICRQILENTNERQDGAEGPMLEQQVRVLLPALTQAMRGASTSLASCATAALVNLSSGHEGTKTLLVVERVLPLCMRQLQRKDDDLTLYTLYLLVNLTKTPHHRAIVVREGAVPLLVEILTSSYQSTRKHKILTEVASVLGHLCNDPDTRDVLSDDFPVVPCLLWINDQAAPNTKLKGKVLFALRQLCVGHNKIKIGEHATCDVLEQLACAKPKNLECAMNAVLLLTMLAAVRSNALQMAHSGRLEEALVACGLQKQAGGEAKDHRFGPDLWEKVEVLKERVRQELVLYSVEAET